MIIEVKSTKSFQKYEQFDPLELVDKELELFHQECAGGKIAGRYGVSP